MAPATFNTLPVELRLTIFEFALADRKPRNVEVFIKSGEIYSGTPPPPLLHVNSESRHITLKFYKPWLPAYRNLSEEKAGSGVWSPALTYTPWEEVIKEHGLEKVSRLQNVCVDLEYDTLLMTGHEFPYPLGPLDEEHILSVAFISNMEHSAAAPEYGNRFPFADTLGAPLQINSLPHVNQLRRFHNLQGLVIYERGRTFETISNSSEHRWRDLEPPFMGSIEEWDEEFLRIQYLPMENILRSRS